MEEKRKLIYDTLKLAGYLIYQERPETIEVFPCITFYISSNIPSVSLIKEVLIQHVEVVVDIWAVDSATTGAMLREIEAKMRNVNFILTFNTDILDDDGYSHLSTRFTY